MLTLVPIATYFERSAFVLGGVMSSLHAARTSVASALAAPDARIVRCFCIGNLLKEGCLSIEAPSYRCQNVRIIRLAA
jgi:hypothetical protein